MANARIYIKKIVSYPIMLIALPVILTGCMSNPERPVDQLARAQASIEQAERADARRYGVMELDSAREKLEQAKDYVEEGDMRQASWLAEEAELDAELAAAKARTRNTEIAVEELEQSIAILRDEIERARRTSGESSNSSL